MNYKFKRKRSPVSSSALVRDRQPALTRHQVEAGRQHRVLDIKNSKHKHLLFFRLCDITQTEGANNEKSFARVLGADNGSNIVCARHISSRVSKEA